MEASTQQVPGYFVWDPPGAIIAVHLKLDVVERIGQDVMRGFALVPKRGAEVGGVLLGSIEAGPKTIVRVEDLESVPTAYRRGPSYFLSEEEQQSFGDAVRRDHNGMIPVGYFRSHTRDGGMGLSGEDLELLSRNLQDKSQVALLIRPYATKVSVAGFFVRRNGTFPAETPLEFPFRRREMLGEEAPARRPIQDRERRPRRERPAEDDTPALDPPMPTPAESATYVPPPPFLQEGPPIKRARSGWVWFPLSFVFLLLGIALGFQAALTFAPELRQKQSGEAFATELSAGRNGDSLTIRWNRDSLAVLAADRAVLEINDGDIVKQVPLDKEQLKEGTVVYQNSFPMVRFQLNLYMAGGVTVHQTVNWSQ